MPSRGAACALALQLLCALAAEEERASIPCVRDAETCDAPSNTFSDIILSAQDTQFMQIRDLPSATNPDDDRMTTCQNVDGWQQTDSNNKCEDYCNPSNQWCDGDSYISHHIRDNGYLVFASDACCCCGGGHHYASTHVCRYNGRLFADITSPDTYVAWWSGWDGTFECTEHGTCRCSGNTVVSASTPFTPGPQRGVEPADPCNSDEDGPCKECVEHEDSYCAGATWDDMCEGVCCGPTVYTLGDGCAEECAGAAVCVDPTPAPTQSPTPPTPAPPEICSGEVDGPCVQCVTSLEAYCASSGYAFWDFICEQKCCEDTCRDVCSGTSKCPACYDYPFPNMHGGLPPPEPPEWWQSSNGYTCADYSHFQWCTRSGGYGPGWGVVSSGTFDEYADEKGLSADEACCLCGGGSHAWKGAPPTPATACTDTNNGATGVGEMGCDAWDEDPTFCKWSPLYYDDDDFTAMLMCCTCSMQPKECKDDPEGWVDTRGFSCSDYNANGFCEHNGDWGPNWDDSWGHFDSFAVDGIDAAEACCICGAGDAKEPPQKLPTPAPPFVCADDPKWHQQGNDVHNCQWVGEDPLYRCSGLVPGIKPWERCWESCGLCNLPKPCVDSPDWRADGKKKQDCMWVLQTMLENPLTCDTAQSKGNKPIFAWMACPLVCGSCPYPPEGPTVTPKPAGPTAAPTAPTPVPPTPVPPTPVPPTPVPPTPVPPTPVPPTPVPPTPAPPTSPFDTEAPTPSPTPGGTVPGTDTAAPTPKPTPGGTVPGTGDTAAPTPSPTRGIQEGPTPAPTWGCPDPIPDVLQTTQSAPSEAGADRIQPALDANYSVGDFITIRDQIFCETRLIVRITDVNDTNDTNVDDANDARLAARKAKSTATARFGEILLWLDSPLVHAYSSGADVYVPIYDDSWNWWITPGPTPVTPEPTESTPEPTVPPEPVAPTPAPTPLGTPGATEEAEPTPAATEEAIPTPEPVPTPATNSTTAAPILPPLVPGIPVVVEAEAGDTTLVVEWPEDVPELSVGDTIIICAPGGAYCEEVVICALELRRSHNSRRTVGSIVCCGGLSFAYPVGSSIFILPDTTTTSAEAPTPAPTPYEPFVWNDPHVNSLAGEKFDVNQPADYTLLRAPLEPAPALLELRASFVSDGVKACGLYMKAVSLSGIWLGDAIVQVRPLKRDAPGQNFAGTMTEWPFSMQISSRGWKSMKDFTPENSSEALTDMVTVVAKENEELGGLLEGQTFVFQIGKSEPLAKIVVSQTAHQALNVELNKVRALGQSELGGLLGTEKHNEDVERLTEECKMSKATGAPMPRGAAGEPDASTASISW